MNEMYEMSIVTHNFGVMGILGVILVNIVMLVMAQDIRIYAKKMRVFMPIGASLIAVILFTGAVMMAAKHLSFSIENIIMIVFGTFLIFFELTRYKKLKHLNLEQENPLETYKKGAFKILQIEFFITLAISVWMLI
ncbi:hypothetical protein KKG72_01965 [bacterium]|nr:hypothetical protein [bacterium]MBU1993244.1 hypothetical protein [bacterium]